VTGAAALALGVTLPAGAALAQGLTVPTPRVDPTAPRVAPIPGGNAFGSVPAAQQRIRVETRDATGATRETRITIQGAPSTGGAHPGPGSRTGFGSVPSFDRQIRITTEGDGPPPLIIIPIRP
jgi:hypothetical protein